MAEIAWTNEAVRWLQDIHDYIAEDNPKAALRVVEGIIQQAQLLRRFPELGYRYEGKSDHHVRILVHGHYRIAYVIKQDRSIDILGVFHSALDIGRYLF